jgi:hypothetical protein
LLISAHHARADGAGNIRTHARHTADARSDAVTLWVYFVGHAGAIVVNTLFR